MFLDKKITVIVAYVFPSGAIGRDGKLLVNCREDMEHFRRTTTSMGDKKNVVVMGRKTFESINSRPLANRLNIVFSSRDITDRCICVKNMQEFTDKIQEIHDRIDEIFIIGGKCIYDLFLDKQIVDKVIATEFFIDRCPPNADTFFNLKKLKEFEITSITRLSDCSVVKTFTKH